MYDIIGDIHGHADHLEKLLEKLGYKNKSGYYKHPERKVIFVGDFIDRGPKIRETLSIVKRMVDENSALAIMGNHEFNALCYYTKKRNGEYIRIHSEKNNDQMEQTKKQFKGNEDEWDYYFEWFRTLPVYLEMGDFRVVHACWDNEHIRRISENKNKIDFSENFLNELFSNEESDLFKALDASLKGKEHKIPNGHSFKDTAGVERFENRFKWWINPEGKTYDECYFEEVKELNGKLMEKEWTNNLKVYPETECPVFCGHYWMKEKEPMIQTKNVVCVDYSIAKDNILAAYKWNGEKELKNENFVSVEKDFS